MTQRALATLIGGLAEKAIPPPLFRFGVQVGREGLFEANRRASAKVDSRCPIATTTSPTSKRFQDIRKQYVEHVIKMFTLAGDAPEQQQRG